MILGVPLERTGTEHRVALAPSGARDMVGRGHEVIVETGAGLASRFADEEYRAAGARLVYDREEVLGRPDLVVKVGALREDEMTLLREGQTVLAFHHLAAARRELLEAACRRGLTLIGYEVLEDAGGDLPILHAMSEIAGPLAVHVAANYLQTRAGGRGILLGGVAGIPPAHVVILGAGVAGVRAARTALGNGAQVSILDISLAALRRAACALGGALVTEVAHPAAVARAARYADVLIGAVLERGGRAPQVVSREMVASMKPGAVVIDLSIDQGGCVETSRPTSLADPVFAVGEVTHYAVPNMTSAVARTASLALTYAALPLLQPLCDRGVAPALAAVPGLAAGVYVFNGGLVSASVGRAFGTRPGSLAALLRAPLGAGARS